jgi:hypothetical protein
VIRTRSVVATAAILLGMAVAVLGALRLSSDRGQGLALVGGALALMVIASVLGGRPPSNTIPPPEGRRS